MSIQKITLRPGIDTQRTPLLNEGGWSSANLIRFREGLPEVMGGWASLGVPSLGSRPNGMHAWTTLAGVKMLAAGSATSGANFLNVIYGGSSYAIIHLTIYGSLGAWTIDNYGEQLIACRRGGQIYVWLPSSGGGTLAVPITNSPTQCNAIFVSNAAEQIIALGYGSNTQVFNPMVVAWCNNGDYTVWTAAPGNNAGQFPLTDGSQIMWGCRAPQQNLIWTDTALYSMQWVGYPLDYSFNQLGTACGLIGPNAAAPIGNAAFWMSNLNFMWYNGTVQVLDCPIRDVVYKNLNWSAAGTIVCSVNSQFSEVRWDYPSSSSSVPDSYVIYNFVDRTWTYGSNTASGSILVSRLSWIDSSVFGNPIAADANGNIWTHETGYTAGGGAMPWYLQSGFFDISAGQDMMFCDMLMPDAILSSGGSYGLTVASSRYTADTPGTAYGEPFTVTASTEFLPLRLRGRQMSVRFDNSPGSVGAFWRLGALRARIAPDGRN